MSRHADALPPDRLDGRTAWRHAELAQATAQTLLPVAFTASTTRLTAGATAMTHCVRSYRSLSSAG